MTVCTFTVTSSLLSPLSHQLQQGNFWVHAFHDSAGFVDFVRETRHQIDCLIIEAYPEISKIFQIFKKSDILLPAILLFQDNVEEGAIASLSSSMSPMEARDSEALTHEALAPGDPIGPSYSHAAHSIDYHGGLYQLPLQKIEYLAASIERAIDAFLQLPPPTLPSPSSPEHSKKASRMQHSALSLIEKQQRLATKLQERLGYLGVFYKRNPNSFLRRLSLDERQTFLAALKEDYRDIILNYFSDQSDLNQKIDRYVTNAFLADVPTAQIVKIHMELMDEFSKHLKLEGRNEEILLDYRLTLIDTIANLCELYRRSVPRSQ